MGTIVVLLASIQLLMHLKLELKNLKHLTSFFVALYIPGELSITSYLGDKLIQCTMYSMSYRCATCVQIAKKNGILAGQYTVYVPTLVCHHMYRVGMHILV
jgi:hypothetical protein